MWGWRKAERDTEEEKEGKRQESAGNEVPAFAGGQTNAASSGMEENNICQNSIQKCILHCKLLRVEEAFSIN